MEEVLYVAHLEEMISKRQQKMEELRKSMLNLEMKMREAYRYMGKIRRSLDRLIEAAGSLDNLEVEESIRKYFDRIYNFLKAEKVSPKRFLWWPLRSLRRILELLSTNSLYESDKNALVYLVKEISGRAPLFNLYGLWVGGNWMLFSKETYEHYLNIANKYLEKVGYLPEDIKRKTLSMLTGIIGLLLGFNKGQVMFTLKSKKSDFYLDLWNDINRNGLLNSGIFGVYKKILNAEVKSYEEIFNNTVKVFLDSELGHYSDIILRKYVGSVRDLVDIFVLRGDKFREIVGFIKEKIGEVENEYNINKFKEHLSKIKDLLSRNPQNGFSIYEDSTQTIISFYDNSTKKRFSVTLDLSRGLVRNIIDKINKVDNPLDIIEDNTQTLYSIGEFLDSYIKVFRAIEELASKITTE